MLAVKEHGGGCCGIKHIYGFNHTDADLTDQELTRVIANLENERPKQKGRLCEVVLTDGQMGSPIRRKALIKHGFFLVFRFKNSNSGNVCNVLHRHIRPLPLDVDLPFEWKGKQAGQAKRLSWWRRVLLVFILERLLRPVGRRYKKIRDWYRYDLRRATRRFFTLLFWALILGVVWGAAFLIVTG